MKHVLDNDFLTISQQITSENKTPEEWSLIESDDMFQEGKYTGGFDSTEMEFTFSLVELDREYWFQLSLDAIREVAEGRKNEVDVIEADL